MRVGLGALGPVVITERDHVPVLSFARAHGAPAAKNVVVERPFVDVPRTGRERLLFLHLSLLIFAAHLSRGRAQKPDSRQPPTAVRAPRAATPPPRCRLA